MRQTQSNAKPPQRDSEANRDQESKSFIDYISEGNKLLVTSLREILDGQAFRTLPPVIRQAFDPSFAVSTLASLALLEREDLQTVRRGLLKLCEMPQVSSIQQDTIRSVYARLEEADRCNTEAQDSAASKLTRFILPLMRDALQTATAYDGGSVQASGLMAVLENPTSGDVRSLREVMTRVDDALLSYTEEQGEISKDLQLLDEVNRALVKKVSNPDATVDLPISQGRRIETRSVPEWNEQERRKYTDLMSRFNDTLAEVQHKLSNYHPEDPSRHQSITEKQAITEIFQATRPLINEILADAQRLTEFYTADDLKLIANAVSTLQAYGRVDEKLVQRVTGALQSTNSGESLKSLWTARSSLRPLEARAEYLERLYDRVLTRDASKLNGLEKLVGDGKGWTVEVEPVDGDPTNLKLRFDLPYPEGGDPDQGSVITVRLEDDAIKHHLRKLIDEKLTQRWNEDSYCVDPEVVKELAKLIPIGQIVTLSGFNEKNGRPVQGSGNIPGTTLPKGLNFTGVSFLDGATVKNVDFINPTAFNFQARGLTFQGKVLLRGNIEPPFTQYAGLLMGADLAGSSVDYNSTFEIDGAMMHGANVEWSSWGVGPHRNLLMWTSAAKMNGFTADAMRRIAAGYWGNTEGPSNDPAQQKKTFWRRGILQNILLGFSKTARTLDQIEELGVQMEGLRVDPNSITNDRVKEAMSVNNMLLQEPRWLEPQYEKAKEIILESGVFEQPDEKVEREAIKASGARGQKVITFCPTKREDDPYDVYVLRFENERAMKCQWHKFQVTRNTDTGELEVKQHQDNVLYVQESAKPEFSSGVIMSVISQAQGYKARGGWGD